jgi:outer membrane lipoprotein-sorting protein
LSHPSVKASDLPKITLKQIQGYLNGIKTFKAKITEIRPNQQSLSGTIYINRATNSDYGKLRIEYDQKDQNLVIADGEKLIFHNPLTKEKETYPIDRTPAVFLLQKKLNLEEDLIIKSFTQHKEEVDLVMSKFGAGDASVTLKFSTSPLLKLKGWTIVDVHENRTEVWLTDVVIGIHLDTSLFTLK